MSTAEPSKNPAPSSSKVKAKEKKQRSSQKAQTERLKTVVRRLPPNLPESVFWQSVQQWVTDDTVTWKEYYPGKFRKRLNKENIPSRAYIAWKNEELLATFSREYDGHVFRDKAGNESIAIVEFAPFQKVPTDKKKADPRMGTIEKDEDYISFIESLKEPASKPSDAEAFEILVASTQPPPPPTTTPLLEALKAEKSAQRDKEAILRNHAHYKEIATSSKNASQKQEAKKKDGKDSGGSSKAPAGKAAEGSQPSKKAAKKAAAAKAAQAQAQGSGQSANTTAPTPTIAKNPAQASSKASPSTASSKQQQAAAANPPKAPRAQRERGASKGAAAAPPPTNASAAPPPVPSAQSNGKAATSDNPAAGGAPAQLGDAAPSRRTRPVIGLASRQFEAALSGAMGGRPRREPRDKDKEKEKDAAGASPAAAASATSPKRKAAAVASPVAPTILQREPQAANTGSAPSGAAPADPPAREDGAGRGRGGRPRGRGRGGRGG